MKSNPRPLAVQTRLDICFWHKKSVSACDRIADEWIRWYSVCGWPRCTALHTKSQNLEENNIEPLLHYRGPSRLRSFNLALKQDDAATRVNSLTLERNMS